MANNNKLRIIAGQWRSRRLPFADFAGVRPTADRIRETVFNWLQNHIAGARCLDLFAGSGALGFEALSRGAAEIVLVDEDLRVIQQLQKNCEELQAEHVEIVWQDSSDYLTTTAEPFDIVFLDPPFRDNVLGNYCQRLETQGWLKPLAWIYLECSRQYDWPVFPENWQLTHSKQSGQVRYGLAKRLA